MGRTKKGQKAIGIANLERAKIESTESRLVWLRDINLSKKSLPNDFNAFTLASFCNYISTDLGFVKQSQNNFKKHLGTDDSVNEVKDILAKLRRKKSSANNTKQTTRTNTAASKDRDITTLKDRVQVLTDDLLSLRIAYNDVVKRLLEEPQKQEANRKAIQDQHRRLGLRIVKD